MPSAEDSSRAAQLQAQLERKFQTYLDKSVPHVSQRWSAFACVALIAPTAAMVDEDDVVARWVVLLLSQARSIR